MKLHIGAFNCAIDGWYNTDVTPHLKIARVPFLADILYRLGRIDWDRYQEHKQGVFSRLSYLDLTKPLPFADNSIEAIFSSHVLEHLFLDEVERLVPEFYRSMRPGAVCRVVVPDLEKIVATYSAEDPRQFLHDIFEISKRGDVKNAHHSGYTGASLSLLFRLAGFSRCAVVGFHKGECPDITRLDNRPDSLFFEAVK